MSKRLLPERSFWSSKVGMAACASIVAMGVTAIATTTVDLGPAHAAPLTLPLADSVVSVGLA